MRFARVSAVEPNGDRAVVVRFDGSPATREDLWRAVERARQQASILYVEAITPRPLPWMIAFAAGFACAPIPTLEQVHRELASETARAVRQLPQDILVRWHVVERGFWGAPLIRHRWPEEG